MPHATRVTRSSPSPAPGTGNPGAGRRSMQTRCVVRDITHEDGAEDEA
jgi:hypothetical protein